MAAPTVQQLSDIVASLNTVYDPQRQAAQTGINTVQDQTTQAETGINAAKEQAFGNITNQANAKGMLFSGFTPDQQAKYTAATYLPTLVKLHAGANDNITKLQQTILGLNSQQQTQAMGIQGDQQKSADQYSQAEAAAALKQQELEQQLAIAQMNNQTKLQAASISASGNAKVVDPAAAFKVKTLSSGNYDFRGPNNSPVSMFQFSQATGQSMLDLLRNSGSAYDRKAYNDAQVWLKQKGEDFALQKLQQHYGKLF